jgi:3-isopropylmalate/(R)-2-methylmalate dehydratase small subunit
VAEPTALAPLRRIVSIAAPLPIPNIDTDVITPMDRIMEGTLVEFAFEVLRFDEAGSPRPEFPLDDPAYAGAQILVTGANFGCGSSRETAVWAVKGLGFKAVIAESFGDIFFSNCFRNGILPVVLPAGEVDALVEAARSGETITVDVEAAFVEVDADRHFPFEIPPVRQMALIEGLDDLALSLRLADEISAFETRDREARPWVQGAALPSE